MTEHVQADPDDAETIRFVARAAGVEEAVVVGRALRALLTAPPADPTEAADPADPASEVPIEAVYRRHLTTATYIPATGRVRITSGPLKDTAYRSPSGAATAVMQAANPDRTGSRVSGRRFWRVTATGERVEAAFP